MEANTPSPTHTPKLETTSKSKRQRTDTMVTVVEEVGVEGGQGGEIEERKITSDTKVTEKIPRIKETSLLKKEK